MTSVGSYSPGPDIVGRRTYLEVREKERGEREEGRREGRRGDGGGRKERWREKGKGYT